MKTKELTFKLSLTKNGQLSSDIEKLVKKDKKPFEVPYMSGTSKYK